MAIVQSIPVYDYIDYELEPEHLAENMRLNEYEFTVDGKLYN